MEDGHHRTFLLPHLTKSRFGSFEFDPLRHELRKRGYRVSMSASQLRLLTLFMERPGELITRDDVAARLWTDTRSIDVATGINTAINRLRRHLQEAPGSPSCIETVIGLGYRFVPELEHTEPVEDKAEQIVGLSESAEADLADQAGPVSKTQEVAAFGAVSAEASGEPEVHGSGVPGQPEHLVSVWLKQWAPALVLSGLVLLGVFATHFVRQWKAFRTGNPSAAAALTMGPMVRVTADAAVGKLTAAAVSPTGQMVAYADPFGVSVHWFPSGAERLLGTRPSFRVGRLAWFPDERGVLMSGTDEALHRQQVWFVPLQGAYLQLLADDANRATVSPDGNTVAFTRNQDRELWVGAADGQEPRRLRSAAAEESFDLLLWSPSGNRLIATLRKASSTANTGSSVDLVNQGAYDFLDADSGSLLDREEGFTASSGYLLRDGSFFFVETVTPGPTSGVSALMRVRIDLGSGRMLEAPQRVRGLDARSAQSLTASLSGTRFAAVLDRAEADVFTADLRSPDPELRNVVRLTRGTKQSFPHSWTANAKGVLVENDSLSPNVSSTKWAIFNQPLDGAKPTLLASLPGDTAMAQLSPDGRWILFLQFTPNPQHVIGIFRIPASGGRIEQVPTHGKIEEFHCSASAAGRCVVREAVMNEELVYYALDPVQGMGEELGRTAWQPNRLGDWGLSADGWMVAAASHDTLHPHIRLVRLRTKPTEVREIALQGHGTVLGASWAPDGQSLFVECRTESGFELVSLGLDGHAKLLRKSFILIWAVPSRDGKRVAFPDLTLNSSVWASNP